MTVIETRGLRKEFVRARGGRVVALAGLDLSVPEGGVFGFLGPNGSGKTTTIRCLLGLVASTAGSCRLLGADSSSESDLARVIRRVGSIVETPALFPGFSGRRNLQLLARLDRIGPKTVEDMLERVGLASRAGDRVRTYSLGMRQRLGIAAALLKDPEVLILDEPANGLDPAGMKEVRDLLRNLAREGRTVFLSSHLLGEVQQVCDRVAILSRGRCIAAGPVGEVLAQGRAAAMLVRVDDTASALAALASAGIDATIQDGLVRANVPADEGARVTKALADRGVYLKELRADEVSLESVFLELTGDGTSGRMAEPPRPDTEPSR
jgi:ABC-2 type transport system ATP-binding protein